MAYKCVNCENEAEFDSNICGECFIKNTNKYSNGVQKNSFVNSLYTCSNCEKQIDKHVFWEHVSFCNRA